ncbi:MAG: hypothetical protein DRI86_00965 [Bacteroidetes bacterium]|nr:MAG: hypothetical protein DRI86_00965 [Bacteroidota bacterium]
MKFLETGNYYNVSLECEFSGIVEIPFKVTRISAFSLINDDEFIDVQSDKNFRSESGELNHKDFDIEIDLVFNFDGEIDEGECVENFKPIVQEQEIDELKKSFAKFAEYINSGEVDFPSEPSNI